MAAKQDIEHLRLLSIFHYVMAGLFILGGLMGIGQAALIGYMFDEFFAMAFEPMRLSACSESEGSTAPAPEGTPPVSSEPDDGHRDTFFSLFTDIAQVFALIGALISMTGAILLFLAGRSLDRKQHWGFCFFVAILLCLQFPLGTTLGVFTLIVLSRVSVKERFAAETA